MTVIVIAYYNRKEQLDKTLETIGKNAPVVVVDDASDQPPRTATITITKEKKYWLSDGTIPYNMGIKKALDVGATNIIIQNAETYHVGDIVGHAEKHLTDENYISYPCFSLSKDGKLITAMTENDRPVQFNGDSGWYNHAKHRPNYYPFCAAITANNIRKLNGFDERFSHGVAMADEDFVRRITLLGLKKEIPYYPYVVHQWHYDGFDPYSNKELYQKNIDLLKSLPDDYRAQHEITKDL